MKKITEFKKSDGTVVNITSDLATALAYCSLLDELGNLDSQSIDDMLGGGEEGIAVCTVNDDDTFSFTPEAEEKFNTWFMYYEGMIREYPPKVMITLDGGLVQCVSANQPVKVVVIDFDVDGAVDDDGNDINAAVHVPHQDSLEGAIANIKFDEVRAEVEECFNEVAV